MLYDVFVKAGQLQMLEGAGARRDQCPIFGAHLAARKAERTATLIGQTHIPKICVLKIFDLYACAEYPTVSVRRIFDMKQFLSTPAQLGHLLASARKAKRLT